MKLAAAVALVAATATLASAEPYDATQGDRRDPGVAIGLSVGGTVASVGLIALGANLSERAGGPAIATIGALSLLVTPALGEIYSGQYFTVGMGLRGAGVLAAGVGMAEALSHLCFGSFDNGTSENECPAQDGTDSFALAMVGLGAASFIGGTIYDIATAGTAAEHYNNTHHLALAPTVIPSQSGPTAAVALGGTF